MLDVWDIWDVLDVRELDSVLVFAVEVLEVGVRDAIIGFGGVIIVVVVTVGVCDLTD